MLEEGADKAEALGEGGKYFSAVENITMEKTELHEVGGRGQSRDGGNLGSI